MNNNMKIQIDIPKKSNDALKIYKVVKGHKNLQDAVNEIIENGVDFKYIEENCKTVGDLQKLDAEVREFTKEEIQDDIPNN